MNTIYGDIAARTGGHVYIGVVGPVRTGKSTLVKRIMEKMVIPGIDEPHRRERARDELPQSGSGRTIMTSEPKFVPEEAVEISPDGVSKLKIRLIDSVGYMVRGAVGAEEDGVPRMVTTPWFDHEIPMTQAAELGTKKVMDGHCTIGLVVTTDGSITDIPREDYLEAEDKAIRDMQATGKPFLVIINTRNPGSQESGFIRQRILEKYRVEPVVCDCQAMEEGDIRELLGKLLMAFPMGKLQIHHPRWLDALDADHPVKKALYDGLKERAEEIRTLGQAEEKLLTLQSLPQIRDYTLREVDLGTGTVKCAITLPEELFYEILSNQAGMEIQTDKELLSLLTELAAIRKEYEKISAALSSVKATGYGVVMPSAEDMVLEKPELLKKGGAFGVKLKAGAPSIHMMRVDIDTEISPMVGDEQQSRDLAEQLTTQDPQNLWQSNIFGKSVYELLQEGLNAKVVRLPEEVRGKFRGTLSRIVNEGATGLICLIL